MLWLDIVVMAVLTITDKLIDKTRPSNADKTAWRAKVKERMNAEDNWLTAEIEKHSG